LLSAIFLLRTRDAELPVPAKDRQPLASEIKEGLVFVVRHPLISRIVACTGGVNFFTTLASTLIPVLVLRELELGPEGMGLILSVGAVGGLIGAVAAPKIAAWIGEGTVIPVASMISALFLLLVPLCVFAPERWMSLVMLVFSEFGFAFGVLVYNIMQLSMRQRVCPPRLLGRMNASIRFVVWGVMPIAALASGLLAEHIGLVPTLWIGVGGSMVFVAPVLFSPLRGMRRLPDAVQGA
jgi:predicted MFS family arabinose efflux permease